MDSGVTYIWASTLTLTEKLFTGHIIQLRLCAVIIITKVKG